MLSLKAWLNSRSTDTLLPKHCRVAVKTLIATVSELEVDGMANTVTLGAVVSDPDPAGIFRPRSGREKLWHQEQSYFLSVTCLL